MDSQSDKNLEMKIEARLANHLEWDSSLEQEQQDVEIVWDRWNLSLVQDEGSAKSPTKIAFDVNPTTRVEEKEEHIPPLTSQPSEHLNGTGESFQKKDDLVEPAKATTTNSSLADVHAIPGSEMEMRELRKENKDLKKKLREQDAVIRKLRNGISISTEYQQTLLDCAKEMMAEINEKNES